MQRPLRSARFLSTFAVSLCVACDGNPGVEEVDRGAKPIEARSVELDAVQLVATGTLEGVRLAVLADEDGSLVGAAAIDEDDAIRWLDIDALEEGRVVPLAGRPAEIDEAGAALLRTALAR